MNFKNIFLSITLVCVISLNLAFAKSIKIDYKHTEISFTTTHLLVSKVNGHFKKFKVDVGMNEAGNLENAVAQIQVSSIDTGMKKRDDHLLSADFFDLANQPNITFTMTKYTGDSKKGKAKGDLTIRGITKPITLDVEIISYKSAKGLSFKGTINRKDFNVGTSFAAKTIGDKLDINIVVTSK